MMPAQVSARECSAIATAHQQPCSTAQDCCCCKNDSIWVMRVGWNAALQHCILCGPKGPAQGCTQVILYSQLPPLERPGCMYDLRHGTKVETWAAAHATLLLRESVLINCQRYSLHVTCTTCNTPAACLLLDTHPPMNPTCWAPTNAHTMLATMNSRRPNLSSLSAAYSRQCLYQGMYTRRIRGVHVLKLRHSRC